jgi:hypothetical protein
MFKTAREASIVIGGAIVIIVGVMGFLLVLTSQCGHDAVFDYDLGEPASSSEVSRESGNKGVDPRGSLQAEHRQCVQDVLEIIARSADGEDLSDVKGRFRRLEIDISATPALYEEVLAESRARNFTVLTRPQVDAIDQAFTTGDEAGAVALMSSIAKAIFDEMYEKSTPREKANSDAVRQWAREHNR